MKNCLRSGLVLMLWLVVTTVRAQEYFFEAENANLIGVTVASAQAGFSGTGYVTGFDEDNDQIVFQVTAREGLFQLTIGYATPNGAKGYELIVNGEKSTGMFAAIKNGFGEQKVGKYLITSGTNTIVIGKGWGWFDIDYIKLSPTFVSFPQKPPNTLIDPAASPATRALFSFLLAQYGKKVLAGQQDMREIEYIKSMTGKSPAIGVFDLIDYSPSRIQFGANPTGSVESWIDWITKGGGLVSLSWHWNAPTDLINQPGKEWWRGFYTDATTFDLATVLANPFGQRYQLLLRDLDAIAEQLKKFKNKNIPVLWRPLHEASGGWFWWGAKGPEPFKELWRLMVDRFVNYHQLHHLIWVYTAGESDWYPGDEYVDVVSLDIYTDASSSMSGEWEAIQALFNGTKLVTLSESGTLPDPNKIRTYAVWWSWFSVWSGSFIRDVKTDFLRQVYADPDVITLDELGELRQIEPAENISRPTQFALQLSPNPCRNETEVQFHTIATRELKLLVFNLLGQNIRTVNLGIQPAGAHLFLFNTEDLPTGWYLLQLKSGSEYVAKKLMIIK